MKKIPGFAYATLIAGLVLGCSQQDSGEPVTDETRTASPATTEATVATRHALPPNNPFLIQGSVYPLVHFDVGATDTTTLPSWPGRSTLEPSQVDWLPGLTTIGTVHRPYAGGEHAIFFAGGNRIGKIRITDDIGNERIVTMNLRGPKR